MSKHIIIELPEIGEDHARWAAADEAGQLVSEVSDGTLQEAGDAVHGQRVTLVIPGDDVLLASASVPGGSIARAQQAVPYALEEQLADDVDELHFALGSRSGGDLWPVAVISRESMDTLTEQCVAAGIRPVAIVPATLALPLENGHDRKEADGEGLHWTALVDAKEAVVRLHGLGGFATDSGMLPLMLEGARADLPTDSTAYLRVYRTDSAAELPASMGVDVDAAHCEERLELFARGLAEAPQINLMQGVYSPRTQFDKAWKPWRSTGVLLAVLGALLFAGKAVDAVTLGRQEAALDAAIADVFNQAMPGARMQRPRAQMTARLNQLSGGNTDGFVARLAQLADSLSTQPQTQLRSISYRNRRFDLDITTDELPTLDALKQALDERGSLELSVQSANREDAGLRARVRVE